jgi:BirA family biotin operon repressor/biotin-[acetyl-CoA-carboxylase] ligase
VEHSNTISIEKHIYLESTPSTNAFLTEYIAKNNPHHNICAYTFKQTDGRGQIGRNWFSDVGKNITLSYLLHFQNLDVQNQFNLNMAISIAISSFIKDHITHGKVHIKWPNDIYVNDNKIAGILIQNQLKGRLISKSVIGIGINVNQDRFPKDIPNPTSLLIENDDEFDKLKLIQGLHIHICKALMRLELNAKSLLSSYLSSFYCINAIHTFIRKENNSEFEGCIKGVSAEGKLLVEVGEDLEAFNFREIGFVIKPTS